MVVLGASQHPRLLQPELLRALSTSIQRKLPNFEARGLADIAWSMAKLQHKDEGHALLLLVRVPALVLQLHPVPDRTAVDAGMLALLPLHRVDCHRAVENRLGLCQVTSRRCTALPGSG